MSKNVTLYWHPSFGAVLAVEADSEVDIAEVLENNTFTSGLTAKDVRFVKRSWFWHMKRLGKSFVHTVKAFFA